MKLISWNVNGLRACMQKGFAEFFTASDADIFCIQESKLQEGQIDFAPEGYYAYWNYAQKKGYSGTAIFTRKEPLSVHYGIGISQHDTEGRVITLEFPDFIWSPATRQIPRMNWQGFPTAWSGKMHFSHI